MAFSRLHPRRGRSKKEWARYWHICKISRQGKQEKQDEKQGIQDQSGIDDKSTSVADSTKVATGGSLASPSHSGGGGTQDHSRQADGVAGEEVTEDLDAIFREVRGR